jgi:ParB family chromosome partitioning protein
MSKNLKERPRLGRGLSSLMAMAPDAAALVETPLQADAASPPPEPAVTQGVAAFPLELPLADIRPNPHQPRKQFSDASLTELAASLLTTGLIQPILVRAVGNHYELIAGERRWRAAKLAGFPAIPALVREVDGMTQAQMALVENIQRENLNPLDRAAAYQSLISQLGVTQVELAARLGEDRSSIANHLRLLELSEPVRNRVAEGALSLGHAKVLASVHDAAEQERLAEWCVAQGLSVRHLERVLAHGPAGGTPKPESPPSPHIQDVEKSVARQLGMRVQLRSTPGMGRGKLVIHYASLDQFDELLQRLGIQLD